MAKSSGNIEIESTKNIIDIDFARDIVSISVKSYNDDMYRKTKDSGSININPDSISMLIRALESIRDMLNQ